MLKKDIIVNYIGQGWSSLLTFLVVPFYLKLLGVESYGLIGFYSVLFTLFAVFDFATALNWKLAQFSVDVLKYKKDMRDITRTLEYIVWGLSLVVVLIVWFLAPVIAYKWLKPGQIPQADILISVRFMSLAVAGSLILQFYRSALMGLHKQMAANILLIGYGCFRVFGSLAVLYFIKQDIKHFFYWQAFAALVFALAFALTLWYFLPKDEIRPVFSKIIFKDIWQYAGFCSLNTIVGICITQIDKIILSKLLTLKAFGYYSIAFTLASGLWIIINPLVAAVFPHFSRIATSGEKELAKFYHRICQLMDLVLLPIAFILIFNAKRILLLWTGDVAVVDNAYFLVLFMVLGITISGLQIVLAQVRAAVGWPSLNLYMNSFMVFLIVPALFLFVPVYGARGAAVIWFVYNLIIFWGYVLITHRRVLKGVVLKWLTQDIAIPLITVALVSAGINFFAYKGNNALLNFFYLIFMYVILVFSCIMATPLNRQVAWGCLNKIIKKGNY